ncbi:class I glutamine amidotransferase-like protein [Artomyces pyxidatus]|uniref:Class I glutamine amidotransferase-like protein n=1 Tax=Artomyces pyxidatus TaxID=48021 RepID=A0ACB8TFB6_9AGAM|nr:class I glutamine amidotransferase-like protein [Artomyces pyxidatus]
MLPTPRLALLVCDTPPPPVRNAHGDYTQIFTTLFRSALPEGLTEFVLDAYDVRGKMEYPSDGVLDSYRGVVITGSAASAYEDVPWINKLVEWVARLASTKPEIKIIGICFGHQIIARAMGGSCVPNSGKWEVGVTEVALSPVGKRIFGAETINIEQMHRDHVPDVPPSFHLLGSTPIAPVQGMVRFADAAEPAEALPPIHILTLQGHPEFTASIVKELVDIRSASGIIDATTAESARSRADWRNDGVSVMGKAIWTVLTA